MIFVRRSSPNLSTIAVSSVADDRALPYGRGQDVVVVRDLRHELVVLIGDLLPLQGGQLAQLHVEDGLRLDLVDLQELHQAGLGLRRRRGPADQRDDLVDAVEGLEQAAQDVGALFGLAQQEARTADDDLDLVVDPVPDELVEAQRTRHALDQGQHVRAERLLQLRVLVQVVEDDLGDRVALEHDDEALARTAGGLVAYVGDPGDLPFLDLLRDLQSEVVRVDLVGEFADDQARTALDLLDLDHGAHGDQAAARTVGVLDAPAADDQAVGREVGALDPLDQRVEELLVGGLVVLQVPRDAGGDLAQVVRRDVGRHADRDAGRAVHQQVGEPAREYVGLLGAAVVVGREVDGLLLDVAQHLHGQRRHAALGVPHGGGRVVARRAEVAVAVDQRVAQRPRLREPYEGVVDRAVAVRVVVTHDVTDDAGALEVAAVGTVTTVVHGVQHPAVHRLEAVAHLGQRSRDDDRHRVVEVAALHLDLDVDRLDPIPWLRRAARSRQSPERPLPA